MKPNNTTKRLFKELDNEVKATEKAMANLKKVIDKSDEEVRECRRL